MPRNFGGVRVVARPVPKASGTGRVFPYPAMEADFEPPVVVKDDISGTRSPFAFKRDRPTPNFLDYAAYYVAGVLCDRHGHVHPLGAWPCKESLDFALGEVHLLAARNLPSKEASRGKADKKDRAKVRGKRGDKSVKNSVRRRG